jgi:hypothetical protein
MSRHTSPTPSTAGDLDAIAAYERRVGTRPRGSGRRVVAPVVAKAGRGSVNRLKLINRNGYSRMKFDLLHQREMLSQASQSMRNKQGHSRIIKSAGVPLNQWRKQKQKSNTNIM